MIRTLLVDDHPSVRRAVRRLLDKHDDIEVVGEAGDGRQALKKIDELRPDVMLLDVNMPVMDGIGVLRELGARKVRPRVVVLTMHGNSEVEKQVFAAGAHALVSKHRAFIELLPAIRAVANSF